MGRWLFKHPLQNGKEVETFLLYLFHKVKVFLAIQITAVDIYDPLLEEKEFVTN